jgi:hypothetical protein
MGEVEHCPWCGEDGTDGDFCDVQCMRDYWRDFRAAEHLEPWPDNEPARGQRE